MKKTKRFLSLIMSFVMIMSLFAGLDISSFAEVDILEYMTYSIDNGEVTIVDFSDKVRILGVLTLPEIIEGYPVTTIGDSAFEDCSIKELIIPEGITEIGNYAFRRFDGKMVLPESLISIGDYAFFCNSIGHIDIPENVTSIGEYAFCNSSLYSIFIPENVISVGDYAFSDCENLTTITVDKNNQYYSSDNYGVFFNKEKSELIQYPIGNERRNYTIPDTVLKIEDFAFNGCENIEKIEIPNSVTNISNSVFEGCNDLEKIYYKGSQEQWDEIQVGEANDILSYLTIEFAEVDIFLCLTYVIENNKVIIENCSTTIRGDIVIPDMIEGYPVTTIGDSAFSDCYGITSVVIPDSVTVIGEEAFHDCDNLIYVVIPKSIVSIEESAFDDLSSRAPKDVFYSGTETDWNNISIGSFNSFYRTNIHYNSNNNHYVSVVTSPTCYEYGYTTYTCSCGYEYVSDYKDAYFREHLFFDECDYCDICSEYFLSYNINEGEVTITDCALTKSGDITIPNMIDGCPVKIIGEEAFYDCVDITSIVIPNSVTVIEDYAFSSCDRLESVAVSKTVKKIDDNAFYSCNNLTDVYYFGDKDDWNIMYIGYDNENLLNARIHYNSDFSHKYSGVVTPPTCTEQGYTTYTCPCGYIYKSDYVYALGGEHVFSEGSEYCDICSDYFLSYEINNGEVTITDCDESITGDIAIPETIEDCPVTSIGNRAFKHCVSITRVVIPNSVTIIEEDAFEFCENLVSVVVPNSVIKIDDSAFSVCFDLTDVYYSGSEEDWNNISIGESNYYYLERAKIHYNTNSNHYETVVTPPTCIEQGYTTFSCPCGYSYTLDYVDSLGHDYSSVVFAPTCTEGGYTVYSCICGDNYTSDYVDPIGNGHVFTDGSEYCDVCSEYFLTYKIENEEVEIIGCATTVSGDIVIPDMLEGYPVTEIYSGAFYACSDITTFILSENIKTIGESVFNNCSGIEKIIVSKDNKYYSSDEHGVLFNKDKTELIYYPDSNPAIEYEIPESVKIIGDLSFYNCSYIEKVVIPSGVTSIGYSAFGWCERLKELHIPESIESFNWNIVAWSRGLERIIVDENNPYYSSDEYGVVFNKDRTSLIIYPENGNAEYVIPKTVKKINDYAFWWCDCLEKITIPDSVTIVGEYAFFDCDNLKSVTIPESVQVIGNNAFGVYGEEGSDEISIIEGFELRGAVGSEAEIYARKRGLSFVEINKNTPTTEPTTKEPATDAPTTEPTTKEPETEVPTTEPTTKEPETEVPTTEPTTKEPITNAPATESTTKEPEAQAPTTEPTTKEPVTDAPTTEKPTDAPTQKPTEKPTEKPVSEKLEVKDDTVKVDDASKISTVKTKSSAEDIIKSVKNKNVSIIDKNGKAISGDTLVGTGAKIQIKDNSGKVVSEYAVCVPNDVDGNGRTTAADARLALRGSAKLEKIEGVYAMASDVTGDNKITAADARKILRISAGLDVM